MTARRIPKPALEHHIPKGALKARRTIPKKVTAP